VITRLVDRALDGDKAWIRLSGAGVERGNMVPAYLIAGKSVAG